MYWLPALLASGTLLSSACHLRQNSKVLQEEIETKAPTQPHQRSFPDRRDFLLERVRALGISTHVTDGSVCAADARSLVFSFENFGELAPEYIKETEKLIQLQVEFLEKYDRPLRFTRVGIGEHCSAYGSHLSLFRWSIRLIGITINRQYQSDMVPIMHRLPPPPREQSEELVRDPSDIAFRVVLYDSDAKRIRKEWGLPLTLHRVARESQPDFATIRMDSLIRDGNYGFIYRATTDQGVEAAFKVFRVPGENHFLLDYSRAKQIERAHDRLAGFCKTENNLCEKSFLIPDLPEWFYHEATDQYYLGQTMKEVEPTNLLDIAPTLAPLDAQSHEQFIERVRKIRLFATTLLKISKKLYESGHSHNDIKPQNILINRDKLLLIDFDSFSRCHEDPVLTLTDGFIPHEAFEGQSTNPSGKWKSNCLNDVFAVGVTTYQTLTKKLLPIALTSGEWTEDSLSSAHQRVTAAMDLINQKATEFGLNEEERLDLNWLVGFVNKAIHRDLEVRRSILRNE